jgi:hypothetical protein
MPSNTGFFDFCLYAITGGISGTYFQAEEYVAGTVFGLVALVSLALYTLARIRNG